LGLLTAVRCNVWQDSESLWSDTIAHTPDEAWMWLSRADARLSRGDVNGALSDLNRSLEIWPQYGDAAFTRALIWEGLANWDAALADYSLAIALNPRDSAALAGRGFVHLKRGEPASALDNFDRSLRLKEEAQVRYNRGLARSAVGDPDGAAEDFGCAAELRPGWTDAEIALAAMQRTLGELDAARRLLDSILDRQPTNVLALGNRALVKLDQADLQGALDDAQVALSIQSRDPLARLVRARALLALGRTAEGCAELARLSAEGRSEAQAILADRCAGG
jgi:tetratricopeptide (TPR) repeat protein